MYIATTTECSIRITIETSVALLVQDEDDTLIAQIGHLIGCDTIGSNHVSVLLSCMVQTINSLKGLPHTGIVHIVVNRVSILGRTTTLEVHTTDVLTTLNPTT